MRAPFATYEQSGRVATITLTRPESRNAISKPSDCQDVIEALRRANEDRAISVAILTGAGAAFCSGGDLKGFKTRDGVGRLKTPDDTRANYRNGIGAMIRAFADVEIATIAAINGAAIGLGLDIAMMCDMRIAARSARMASSFLKVGLVPGDGGAWILQKAIGYARAAELILTGDQFSADDALAMGLVNKVADDADLMADARALAERIAVNPPRSVRLTKRLLRQAQHARLSDVLELSAAFQAISHETADHEEAVEAFLAKRPPNFTGS